MEKTLRDIQFTRTVNGRKSTFSLMDLLEALLLDERSNNLAKENRSVPIRTRNGESHAENEWDSLNKDIWVSYYCLIFPRSGGKIHSPKIILWLFIESCNNVTVFGQL